MAENAQNMTGDNKVVGNIQPEPKKAPPQPQAEERVKEPNFSNLGAGVATGENITSIDMIMDIPVTVSVELGRTKLLIKELLGLGQGSVVELEKLAGEPVEVLVNGKLIARGEVVVVDDKFGIKLTDIVSVTERINRLK